MDSILAQTYTNWVMICCDDGSTDGTLGVLRRYDEQYPGKFIVLENGENRKLPYSLNHCHEHVETELVARMNADDWSLPERLFRLGSTEKYTSGGSDRVRFNGASL